MIHSTLHHRVCITIALLTNPLPPSPSFPPPHTGHIGHLHITIPWLSFRTNPIHITVSDVFLLVRIREESNQPDPREEERRDQEAKQERLRNAEGLDAAAAAGQGAAGAGEEGVFPCFWLFVLSHWGREMGTED